MTEPIPPSQQPRGLCRVFRDWADGKLGGAEFASRVFQNLTPDNLNDLLAAVGPDGLSILKSAVVSAPATERGWAEFFVLESWCGPWNEEVAEQRRRANQEAVTRYRRGIDAFRQSLG